MQHSTAQISAICSRFISENGRKVTVLCLSISLLIGGAAEKRVFAQSTNAGDVAFEPAISPTPLESVILDSNLGPTSEMSDGVVYNIHSFSGAAGQQIIIEMVSAEFDTYLALLAPSGDIVAENDDSIGSTNAQITATLPETGTYFVMATSFGGASLGNYTTDLACG